MKSGSLLVLAVIGLLACGCGKGSPFGPPEKEDDSIFKLSDLQDGSVTLNSYQANNQSTINVNSHNEGGATAKKK